MLWGKKPRGIALVLGSLALFALPVAAGRAQTATSSGDIIEKLAVEAESAKMPLQKALRRASRRALMWEEEAAALLEQGRSLTELTAVGPYLEKFLTRWIEDPLRVPQRPNIRRQFLTVTEARTILAKKPPGCAR